MKSKAFTLIELLVTMTIIVLMAVVAIPSFGKHQALIELQNKADEIKAGLDGMHLKAMNPEQGVTRYYANMDASTDKVDYGSIGTNNTIYKTINLTSDQTLGMISPSKTYLVCDKGKSYCCNVTSIATGCPESDFVNNTNVDDYLLKISNTSLNKTSTFKIFANPFRVTLTQ